MKREPLDAQVRLTEVKHLFVASDDPFHPDYDASGVLEQLAYDLYTRPSYRSVHLTLELPPSEATPAAIDRTRDAIRSYCARQVREYDRTRRGERWRALRALVGALLVLVLAVIVNRATRDVDSFWVELFVEGLAIAFWVVLWFPLDSLVFGQWQHRLDTRIYDALREMEVTIIADTARPAVER